MTQNQNLPSPAGDRCFRRIADFCREYRYSLIASLLFGLLAYAFVFTNKLLNHDELGNLFGLGYTVSSGRWGLELIGRAMPTYSMPWLNGMGTLLLMALSVCVILKLFSIRSPVLQFLLSGLIIVFPPLIGTFCFMFTSPSYGVSFLLAVLSVFCFTRKKALPVLIGIPLCIFSLSIYQGYLPLMASLLVLFLIRELMYENHAPLKTLWEGLFYVGLLVVSLAVYWGISQVFLRSAGGMNFYAEDAMEQSRSLAVRLEETLVYFLMKFTEGHCGLFRPGFSLAVHGLCILAILGEGLFWCLHRENLKRLPMLLLLLAMLPIAMSSLVLMVSFSSAHTLTCYSFIAIYILAAFMVEEGKQLSSVRAALSRVRALLMDLAMVSMALIIASNIFFANRAYLSLYLNNLQNYSFCTTLTTQLELLPGYEEDMPVVLTGKYPEARYMEEFSDLYALCGADGLSTISWSYGDLLKYYCSTEVNLVNYPDAETREFLNTSPEVAAMPAYPNAGFLQILDGKVIVKLPQVQ